MNEILTIVLTGVGTAITIIGFVYTIIRNFRSDFDTRFDQRFDKLERKLESQEQRWVETNKRMDGVYHMLLKKMSENSKG